MKKLIEELVYQAFLDLALKALYRLAEWLTALPWENWLG